MDELPIDRAVIISTRAGAQRRLERLRSLLTGAGVAVEIVETAEDAAARLLLADPSSPHCVLLDALEAADGLPRTVGPVLGKLRDLCSTVPHVAPIVVSADPAGTLVVQCYRAGASEFIDLTSETAEGVRGALSRVAQTYRRKLEQRQRVRELRSVVEEFLRDLVKTERRSIDLEHKLAAKESASVDPVNRLDSERLPVVFIIEDDIEVADLLVDELEDSGLSTYAFVSGEDAVLEARKLVGRNEPIDLTLTDWRLPGIDGLEAVRQLREIIPDLAAIVMTGYSDQATAASAADLGVVGYVLKPFDDIGGLVGRIKEQAEHSRDRGRERLYLERIKQRHEKVLLGYRKLAAEIDKAFE